MRACARRRSLQRTEAQRVQQRDRPAPHREDVADDPADAGGRALVRLDEGRMVVRLDLEDRREAAADVDRAGVLARPCSTALAPFVGSFFEVDPRALVAAVPRTTYEKMPSSVQRRLALQRAACDRIVLDRGSGPSIAAAARVDAGLRERQRGDDDLNSTRPSALPSAASQRARDAASADDVARLVADAGDVVDGAVGLRRRSSRPRVAVAEDDAARRSSSRDLGRRVVVASPCATDRSTALARRRVNGVSVCSTRT
jgi:hypothetical protein